MLERIIINNLKIDMKAEDAAPFLGRRAARLNMDELIRAVNSAAKPKFIVREVSCRTDGDKVYIDDSVFESSELALKLAGCSTVMIYSGTAGNEIMQNDFTDNANIKELLTGAMFVYSMKAFTAFLRDLAGFSEYSVINPGLVENWPVSANRELCRILGGIGELEVSMNEAGYMTPINSNAGIIIFR